MAGDSRSTCQSLLELDDVEDVDEDEDFSEEDFVEEEPVEESEDAAVESPSEDDFEGESDLDPFTDELLVRLSFL